jgi:cell division protein FtsQ
MLRTLACALLSVGALCAGYCAGGAVVHARALEVNRFVVSGHLRLSAEDVRTLLEGMRGENILWVNLDDWRLKLQASPWVRDAAFRRRLPSSIEVTITEQEPIAIARLGGALYLIDERGNVMDQYGPRYANFDLPLVDGLAGRSRGATAADPSRAELATSLIVALQADQEIARQLSQVNVSDAANASVLLADDPAVLYVGRERFLARVRSYVQLAPTLRARVPDIDSVDLRFDDRMYVRPGRSRRGTDSAAPVAVRTAGAGPARGAGTNR